MRMLIPVIAVLALVLADGCEKTAPQNADGAGTNRVADTPTVKDTVGTVLQYDNLKAGRSAQDRARRATEAHNKRLEEAIPEDQ